MLLAFWFLAAVNAALFRPPTSPRYTYIGAVFVLMVVAELLRGTRPPRWAAGAVFVVAAVAIAANAVNLRDGYRTFEALSTNERAGVSAIELARDTVEPDFLLTQENSDAPFFDYVDAESYLSAVDAFGSPGYTEPELLAASDHVRVAADKALAAAERIAPAPATPPARDDPVCRELAPDAAGNRVLELGPGTATLAAGPRSRLRISAGRYSPGTYPVELGSLAGREAVGLEIPQDRGEAPWRILIAGEGTVRVCEG